MYEALLDRLHTLPGSEVLLPIQQLIDSVTVAFDNALAQFENELKDEEVLPY